MEPDFIGKWKNELGSILEITAYKEGVFKGTYCTAAGQPKPSQEFPVSGVYQNNAKESNSWLLQFTVN